MFELWKMTVIEPKEFCQRIEKRLANFGIEQEFLPHLKELFLQGASFMDGNKIAAEPTVRGKDADIFRLEFIDNYTVRHSWAIQEYRFVVYLI